MLKTSGPGACFSKNPKTFRAHFGCHNTLCIFKTKASRVTKLCSYFYFYSLYNIGKKTALQNKEDGVLGMAFRAPKVFGTFEKRAPGGKVSMKSDRKKATKKATRIFNVGSLDTSIPPS